MVMKIFETLKYLIEVRLGLSEGTDGFLKINMENSAWGLSLDLPFMDFNVWKINSEWNEPI